MALEDIERLKEKLDKDPQSKLFVPLAEEYKKEGMFDEAIDVLIKGLERQPNYLSARVSLGKIYIERGMLKEAMAEFEKVISTIPDNLYAHKKLAEIYRDLGDLNRARKEFKTVLKLNPMDEWATMSLAALDEFVFRPEKPAEEQVVEKIEEKILTEVPPEDKIQEEAQTEFPISEEDIEIRKPESEAFEELEAGKEKVPEISEIQEEEDLWAFPDEEEIEEEKLSEISSVEEVTDIWGAPQEATEEAEETGAENALEIEELSEEISFEDIVKEVEAVPEEEEPASIMSIKDADSYILQGKYLEAVKIYKNLLSSEPQNNQILQRVEELKALLKLLGKDKEELIVKLENLLEGIRKRRDEFFRSS